MARGHELVYALNAGGVDKEAITRVDLEKLRLAGEHPVKNLLPRVLGSAPLRPGLEYLFPVPNNGASRLVPFEYSEGLSYALAFTDSEYRIIKDKSFTSYVSQSAAIINGDFTASLSSSATTGWQDLSSGGATASTAGGLLKLKALGVNPAKVQQQVAITNQSGAHTIRLEVTRGPVLFRIGSTAGDQDILGETEYRTGTHKITVTPNAAAMHLTIKSEDDVERQVSRVDFEYAITGTSGDLVIPSPYLAADLPNLSWDKSVSVIFMGDGKNRQQQIEYRGDGSWSMTEYLTDDGPFTYNTNRTQTMTPAATTGNTTITSSEPIFRSEHVGTLIEITHRQQSIAATLTGADQSSGYITVNGISGDRIFQRTADFTTGSFVGTLTLERSTEPSDPVIWGDYKSFTVGFPSTDEDDKLNNLTVHYRFSIKTGDYTSGTVDVNLDYDGGSQTGIARITSVTSSTVVEVEVLKAFGAPAASRDYRLGDWSGVNGWPRVPCLAKGRLWWFRKDQVYGSVSDAYSSYDDNEIGDSGPVVRSVGSRTVEGVQWAIDLDRLAIGTYGFEATIQANDFGDVITPTAYNVNKGSTFGSSKVPAVATDDALFFVHKSGKRLYEFYRSDTDAYRTRDITRLIPHSIEAGIKAMAIQRQPDTRLYLVLDDGQCFVLTYERDDEVVGFTTIEQPGLTFEDVIVLPSTEQDRVLFQVNLNGTRSYMRLADERDQRAAATCALLDAHVVYSGANSVLTGLDHLEGRSDVYAYVDGLRQGPFTVSSGQITLTTPSVTRAVAGLKYDGAFKSVKLAYAAQLGTAVGQLKQVHRVGLLMQNSCLDGVKVGTSETRLDPIPQYIDGAQRVAGAVVDHYDHELQQVPSGWSPDSRIYFEADSSYGPFTAQAIAFDIETAESYTPRRRGQ